MHELSIVMSVVEEVGRILAQEGKCKVHTVTLSIGALSGVEKEPLETCFPMAADGTACENAKLVIEKLPVEVQCSACSSRTQVEVPFFKCAKCGAASVQIVQGYELNIKSLEVE
jgi:hydrogenase nickel incorporation protein HypA/HybF